MKLLLDQMLDADVAKILHERQFDVIRASDEGMQRADDEEILQWCAANNRILITLDSDFGDWAVLPLSEHAGVIRIKGKPATTENILSILIPFIVSHRSVEFSNKLVIVTKQKARWIKTGF